MTISCSSSRNGEGPFGSDPVSDVEQPAVLVELAALERVLVGVDGPLEHLAVGDVVEVEHGHTVGAARIVVGQHPVTP